MAIVVIILLILFGTFLVVYRNRCNHRYTQIAYIPCEYNYANGVSRYVPVTLYECLNCGKRIVIRDNDHFYRKTFLKKLRLWESGQCAYEQID